MQIITIAYALPMRNTTLTTLLATFLAILLTAILTTLTTILNDHPAYPFKIWEGLSILWEMTSKKIRHRHFLDCMYALEERRLSEYKTAP
ncbi:hypothetical protein BDW59DRAFT_155389 [Aspergillus cavernicola]|uniref:Uncharacterized protein n=1 Tax=Aspergillus cavernicola TaxID=176166 RepID=A0ABR4H994_9EURO